MKYEFTADLETKNDIIDSEHKTLINAVNDLMMQISLGHGKENVLSALAFLLDYTKKHFAHEEELQASSSYPMMAPHREWHKKFVSELDTFAQRAQEETSSSIVVIELTNITTKLIKHIKNDDKALAIHLNAV